MTTMSAPAPSSRLRIRWRTVFDRVLVGIALIALWQFGSWWFGAYWLSSPWATAVRFVEQTISGELGKSACDVTAAHRGSGPLVIYDGCSYLLPTIVRPKDQPHVRFIFGCVGIPWAAFTGSDELAAVDGDFIMTAAEVQPVLRALRKAGIHVVALHNHMVGEQPSFYFTHFWAKGSTEDLATGLKSALDTQAAASKKGKH